MIAKRLFRTLGLSTLVAVGVMAVSASAAQAKWLIRVGGVSVSSVKLTGEIEFSSELLVGGLAFDVNCSGGTGVAEIKVTESNSQILGNGTVELTGCTVVGAEEACMINTPNQTTGTILASGSGVGEMAGAKIFTELVSSEFTRVAISGEECPFTEVEEVISGSGTGTLVNAETEQKIHAVEVDDKKLFFGAELVQLHGKEGQGSAVKVTAEEESGKAWAIGLVGL